jgi:hypothetical protein
MKDGYIDYLYVYLNRSQLSPKLPIVSNELKPFHFFFLLLPSSSVFLLGRRQKNPWLAWVDDETARRARVAEWDPESQIPIGLAPWLAKQL